MSQTVIISCYQIKINLIIQKGKLNDPILTGFLGLMLYKQIRLGLVGNLTYYLYLPCI